MAMFSKKYFPVPVHQARPHTPPPPVTYFDEDGIEQERKSKVMPHVDFHARLAGYNRSKARDSLYAYVVFLDKKIWRTHRRNMAEMHADYEENYFERMGTVETFPVGGSAVVYTVTGRVAYFVRVTVIKVREMSDPPTFLCIGWDDCEEYETVLSDIFEMTPQAADYPCMAVPLSLEGLHGFYDCEEMLSSFRKAWAECGAVYAGRCLKLKPNLDFQIPREEARMRTYELRSFCNQTLNERIAAEFVKQLDINKHKSTNLRVVVTNIDNFSNIWFQLEGDGYLGRINFICDQNAATKEPVSEVKTQMDGPQRVYAALGIDGKYHRATVTQEVGEDRALVQFIDYGIKDTCKYANMYDLTKFDSLTACLGPRCMRVFLHNALQNLRLSDDERDAMLERVNSFTPNTTIAIFTGYIVDSVLKKKMDVYEIIGRLGRRGLQTVNIHGKPQDPNPYNKIHGKPQDPNPYDKIHGTPDDYDPEEPPPDFQHVIRRINKLNM